MAGASGARVSVIALNWRVDAASGRITGLCRAGVRVVAEQDRIDNACARQRVASFEAVAGIAVVALYGSEDAAAGRIAGIIGTQVLVIADKKSAGDALAGVRTARLEAVTRISVIARGGIAAADPRVAYIVIRTEIAIVTGLPVGDVRIASLWHPARAARHGRRTITFTARLAPQALVNNSITIVVLSIAYFLSGGATHTVCAS